MDDVTIIDNQRFYCQQCGECCKHLDVVDFLPEYNRGDGVCKYLRADNKCSIYNERPSVCRGEYIYHKYYEYMSVKDYYELLYSLCEKIRKGIGRNERL